MTMANHTLIEKFTDGEKKGQASRIFIDSDVMYSYGKHFPLLVRRNGGENYKRGSKEWCKVANELLDKGTWFLLNADKRSVSTTRHQNYCFRIAYASIPFSALTNAGFNPHKLIIVDKAEEMWEVIKYSKYPVSLPREYLSIEAYNALQDKTGWQRVEERHPESTVITQDGRYALSSMDERNYFISELPKPVKTVAQAFASLKPYAVKDRKYIRQGEWFFVSAPVPEPKKFYSAMEMGFTLPKETPQSNEHVATRGLQVGNKLFVSGRVRHLRPRGGRADHRTATLSTLKDIQIFGAYKNRAIASWSASGGVD